MFVHCVGAVENATSNFSIIFNQPKLCQVDKALQKFYSATTNSSPVAVVKTC